MSDTTKEAEEMIEKLRWAHRLGDVIVGKILRDLNSPEAERKYMVKRTIYDESVFCFTRKDRVEMVSINLRTGDIGLLSGVSDKESLKIVANQVGVT